MPRRPRPALRSKATRQEDHIPASIPEEHSHIDSEDEASSAAEEDAEEDEDAFEDADAPRVTQWVADDDEDGESSSESEAGPSNLADVQNDISSIPLGVLRKAQTKVIAEAETDDDGESDSGSEVEQVPIKSVKGKEKEWSTRPRPDIAKRSNKHAPTEVTSKRPVTRTRIVVTPTALQSRDPRFLPTTGEFSKDAHRSNYGFLTGAHQDELKMLREDVKLKRKRMSSVPLYQRPEKEAEISALELAIKRAESSVDRDRRERIEHDALRKVAREEKEKQKQGKGDWFMKKSEKKELIVRAKYEDIASRGGNQAVKKAIAKKQKKTAQSEKRSRPRFEESGRPNKRLKV